MSAIRAPVAHQATAASANSTATSPTRARTAAHAGARPVPAAAWSDAAAITSSGGPREAGLREPGTALELDPERADPRALRLGHREVRADRVAHPREADRLAGLDPDRHGFLDLEVDRVPPPAAVPDAVVLDVDPGAPPAEHLPDERGEPGHRTADLPAEDL